MNATSGECVRRGWGWGGGGGGGGLVKVGGAGYSPKAWIFYMKKNKVMASQSQSCLSGQEYRI